MFTGIIEKILIIEDKKEENDLIRITFSLPDSWKSSLHKSASVAVNGICLTIVDISEKSFSIEAMVETACRTTLSSWEKGQLVNAEKALTASNALDGHFVLGHVDTIASIHTISLDSKGNRLLSFSIKDDFSKFIAQKGSISIDGVSLTVIDSTNNQFNVGIIPFTWDHTIFHTYTKHTEVNVEIDVIARYVVNFFEKKESLKK